RTQKLFQTMLATSSNPEALTATATTKAQPGTFKFIVKQLVSTSQKLSQGFATSDATPLGLDDISFEFGNGNLARDRSLTELNGGTGVDRGRIKITSGATTATIDLTDVTTVNEVLDRINSNTEVDITATVRNDQIVLTDGSGGPFTVTNGTGDTTATDLGIAGTSVGPELVGADVYGLAGGIALGDLNDGNGVLIRDNIADILIQSKDPLVAFNIDLGRVDAPIVGTTELSELNNGSGVTINDDSDDPDIKFVTRDGSEYEVDLTGATTVDDVISRVSTQTGGDVTLSIHADGDKLVVTDNTVGGGNLQVLGAGENDTDTAEDLGILNEAGTPAASFDGELIPNTISTPAAVTLQDVMDRINNAEDTLGNPNAGRIVASIAPDGRRLLITDTTGGPQNLQIFNANVGDTFGAATDLGIATSGFGEPTAVKTGDAIYGALDSVLAASINGGNGLGGATTINITDRTGVASLTLANLDTYDTLQEIIDAVNAEATAQGVQVSVGLNSTGTGLSVTDTSGGALDLKVSGDAATALGIEFTGPSDTVHGSNAQLQYVAEATLLSDLNYGRGIGTGSFRITDGLGATAVVDIGGSEKTVYDVIAEINSRGLAVQARINDQGDGLIIEEDPAALGGDTPFVNIKVESVSGTTAADLNLLGESEDVVGGFIDGSYERVVDLDTGDSLDDVVSKINAAGIPVNAALINSGSGPTPYRFNLTSGITGAAGELVIDSGGVDLGLTSLSRGEDAKVFFGADDPEDGLLVTSATNTLKDVVQGLTIDLLAASDDPVTLTIERDETAIVDSMRGFVTAFNDAIERIGAYDFFDVESEQRGVLLGDPTVSRVRSALYRVANGRAMNVDGSYQYLSQVGIRFNGEGQMTFDESKFQSAYDADPEGVEALIAAYDASSAAAEEIAPGVTVSSGDLEFNSLGIGNLFDNMLDDLTNSIGGVLTLADDAFEDRIDLLNDRIDAFDVRLEARRDILQREFTTMETVLAQLQSQSNALGSLFSNLSLAASQASAF
ncbi:MAG: flagellar filament capping protein FliD, partial [Phycisphaerae bacterium]|nr:flagellar filament capping protein FliD [Phycisphaerae bacterium]